ncbi:hypothetical protein [Baaleninema sp.]|uniref:hypothetical protein n=1 Tax=Baaleninema sp. TaxID=3101197 RepID=UPI003D024B1C
MTFQYSIPETDKIGSAILSENRSKYGAKKSLEDVWEPVETASPEVKKIIEDVLKIERRRLYTQKNYGVTHDVLQVIYNVIPE